MENTQEQKTPETLKPEQMESGKWYFLKTHYFEWFIKFLKIEKSSICIEKAVEKDKPNSKFTKKSNHCDISVVESIRPATKDEVLKYFPDEVFEPIELRPEDLVKGEVYTFINDFGDKSLLKFSGKFNEVEVYYHVLKYENGKIQYNDWVNAKGKFYHATPEEKKLLLGEEETKPKLKTYEQQLLEVKLKESEYNLMDAKKECSDWEAKYNELKAKFDQLEQKGEKVYFYFNRDMEKIEIAKSLDEAKINSEECHPIYEAVCIGKKKSILVNE